MDPIVDNAAEALLELVNTAAQVCKEHDAETGHPVIPSVPTSKAIADLKTAYRVVAAAFGLVSTDNDMYAEPEDTSEWN